MSAIATLLHEARQHEHDARYTDGPAWAQATAQALACRREARRQLMAALPTARQAATQAVAAEWSRIRQLAATLAASQNQEAAEELKRAA